MLPKWTQHVKTPPQLATENHEGLAQDTPKADVHVLIKGPP